MWKILTTGITTVLGIGLGVLIQAPPPPDGPPRPPEKKTGPGGPDGELRRAYDLLRHLRAQDSPAGKTEERLRDLTDRATRLYRKAVAAREAGEARSAREYGAAAHDLARAVDHARNASLLVRPDPELPPPPASAGPESPRARARRDLRRAYDRIVENRDRDFGPGSRFYLDAARDLYKAARRDAEDDRDERAGQLALASEAITHVPEHLAWAQDDRPEPPKEKARKDRPEPKEKAKKDRGNEKRDRPVPPPERRERPEPEDALPPPIDE
jgi:hypothetical protein